MSGNVSLGRVGGVEVRIDWSWLGISTDIARGFGYLFIGLGIAVTWPDSCRSQISRERSR